jgi:hypothetical protein
MADPRMSDAAYEAYKPYVEEILDLINQHIRRRPEPQMLGDAWRVGLVTVLTEVIRAYRLLPGELDDYLQRVCGTIIENTKIAVRNWDEAGPQRP